ncbi:MAG: 1-aminocyclopropane-1-carboxylate deaminase/D-cysteine desulfhydrase [Vicinamibacterales bacterium]
MSLDRLTAFLAAVPRVPLGTFPTPLTRLDRLSARLGVDLWMKRDECSGVAMGGNKTRKLEYVLADAMARGFGSVVTVGPVTSNHTMMTATACRRVGLDVHCVVAGAAPADQAAWSGNLLLLDYLGATLHVCPVDFSHPTPEDGARVDAFCRRVTAETGGYFIPGGGTMPAAEPGYMACVAEIAAQRGGRFDFPHVVVAYGTGSTTTGLLLGLALGGVDARVHPVAIETRYAVEEAFRLPSPASLFLDSSRHFNLGLGPDDVPPHAIVYGHAEEGYGVPNRGSDAAIRLMASEEGYFLDTVYTAKAFAGLCGLIERRAIPAGARVLFVHTGGQSMTPAAEKRFAGAP